MKMAVLDALSSIEVQVERGGSLSLFTVFYELLTETKDHDNPKKAKKVYYDNLVERYQFEIHYKGISHTYFDCLYLFCNACLLGLIKPKDIKAKFSILCNRDNFNEAEDDEDALWDLVTSFYREVSYG